MPKVMAGKNYIIQKECSARCATCGNRMMLLSPDDPSFMGLPIFFVCFTDRVIVEAGIGVVPDASMGSPSEKIPPAPPSSVGV